MKIYAIFHKSGELFYSSHDPDQRDAWLKKPDAPEEFVAIDLNQHGKPFDADERAKLDKHTAIVEKKPVKKPKVEEPEEPAILEQE